jgi:hypothetical protein
MARPQRNTVDYFPHILGEGKKMFYIEQKYGNDGYATWYKILEKLGGTENHFLNLNKEEEVMFLASKCRVEESMLILIIEDLVKIGVFDKDLWDSKVIWCQQFVDSISDAYKKRNNKCITLEGLGILLEGLGIRKPLKSNLKVSVNTQSIVKDSIVNKSKEETDFVSDDFKPAFNKWMEYKSQRKQKYKSTASEKSFYNKLFDYSKGSPEIADKIIERSMASNWSGIFELPEQEFKNAFRKKYRLTSANGSQDFNLTETELSEKLNSGFWKIVE